MQGRVPFKTRNQFVAGMGVTRKVGLVLAMIAISTIQLNSNDINSIFARDNNEQIDRADLVPLQDDEVWLIVPINFNDNDENTVDEAVLEMEIREMMEGEDGAAAYLRQASAGRTHLNYVISSFHTPTYSIDHYGSDIVERDHLVQDLIIDFIKNIPSYILNGALNGESDLDGDEVIDRVLFLHDSEPQETGGGPDSIWSHFSYLDEEVHHNGFRFQHYTISSVKSGIGTIIHEMLHQMGGYDLYDVHGDVPSRDWNGIGDWGIMASGNWNGGGSIPALPTASTLSIIDPGRDLIEIDVQENSSHTISSFSQTGDVAAIPVSDSETVFMTYRDNTGFDRGLPGNGILIEYQDTANGDIEENMLNSNPQFPWTYIIEADANDALILGDNDGEHTDTFQAGSMLGNQGIQIRDSSGKLVPWSVEIVDIQDGNALIDVRISKPEVLATIERSPIVLLKNQSLSAHVFLENDCELEINSKWSPSESDRLIVREFLTNGNYNFTVLELSETSRSKGTLELTVGCIDPEGEVIVDADFLTKWYLVEHKIVEREVRLDIDSTKDQTIMLETVMIGSGTMFYNLHIDGPASRVVEIESVASLESGEPIPLSITPNGLLGASMLARGEVVLVDNNGIQTNLPFVLYTESRLNDIPFLDWISTPSNGISIAILLLALSSYKSQKKIDKNDTNTTVESLTHEELNYVYSDST